MYDKKLFEKIINCDASYDELKSFFPQNKREYDLDNSFDKYFSLAKTKHAIDLYNSKKIDDNYLSHWACAYYWIFMASNWNSTNNITLKYNIEDEIADWFDSLSFFDDSMLTDINADYLTNFWDSLQMLYDIRQNIDEWIAYYKTDTTCVEPLDEAVILCVNEKNKRYLLINGVLDDEIRQSDKYLKEDEFDNTEAELINLKYTALQSYSIK